MIDPKVMTEAMMWVSKITSVGFIMVLPIIGGMWLDNHFGIKFCTLLGLFIGFGGGLYHLLKITKG